MSKVIATGLVAFLLVFGNSIVSGMSPKTPQIEAKKESNVRIHDKKDADHAEGQAPATSLTVTQGSNPDKAGQHSTEEGTEFWPPFFGYKLKVTDSLLIFINIFLMVFNGLLVLSNNRLWKESCAARASTEKAAQAAIKSAKVAEQALLSVERPYLFVYGIQTSMDSERGTAEGFLVDPVITCTVVNHGKLPATIESVRAGISLTAGGVPEPVDSVADTHELLLNPTIGTADDRERVGVMFCGKPGMAVTGGTNEAVFFRVVISYRGPFTQNHESSFCWRFSPSDPAQWRFIPFSHPDYAYMKQNA